MQVYFDHISLIDCFNQQIHGEFVSEMEDQVMNWI